MTLTINDLQKSNWYVFPPEARIFVYVYVYFWPPVRTVCPNHDVVVFQPRTGTAPDLVSVANYTFYYNRPAPPVSTVFLDLVIYLFHPTDPHQ